MNKKIKELEELLKEKDIIINKLKKEKIKISLKSNQLNFEKNIINEKLNKIIFESNKKICQKEKIIKQYELKISQFHFKFSPIEKIISIIFTSLDQNIICPFICKNTDIFKFI